MRAKTNRKWCIAAVFLCYWLASITAEASPASPACEIRINSLERSKKPLKSPAELQELERASAKATALAKHAANCELKINANDTKSVFSTKNLFRAEFKCLDNKEKRITAYYDKKGMVLAIKTNDKGKIFTKCVF